MIFLVKNESAVTQFLFQFPALNLPLWNYNAVHPLLGTGFPEIIQIRDMDLKKKNQILNIPIDTVLITWWKWSDNKRVYKTLIISHLTKITYLCKVKFTSKGVYQYFHFRDYISIKSQLDILSTRSLTNFPNTPRLNEKVRNVLSAKHLSFGKHLCISHFSSVSPKMAMFFYLFLG